MANKNYYEEAYHATKYEHVPRGYRNEKPPAAQARRMKNYSNTTGQNINHGYYYDNSAGEDGNAIYEESVDWQQPVYQVEKRKSSHSHVQTKKSNSPAVNTPRYYRDVPHRRPSALCIPILSQPEPSIRRKTKSQGRLDGNEREGGRSRYRPRQSRHHHHSSQQPAVMNEQTDIESSSGDGRRSLNSHTYSSGSLSVDISSQVENLNQSFNAVTKERKGKKIIYGEMEQIHIDGNYFKQPRRIKHHSRRQRNPTKHPEQWVSDNKLWDLPEENLECEGCYSEQAPQKSGTTLKEGETDQKKFFEDLFSGVLAQGGIDNLPKKQRLDFIKEAYEKYSATMEATDKLVENVTDPKEVIKNKPDSKTAPKSTVTDSDLYRVYKSINIGPYMQQCSNEPNVPGETKNNDNEEELRNFLRNVKPRRKTMKIEPDPNVKDSIPRYPNLIHQVSSRLNAENVKEGTNSCQNNAGNAGGNDFHDLNYHYNTHQTDNGPTCSHFAQGKCCGTDSHAQTYSKSISAYDGPGVYYPITEGRCNANSRCAEGSNVSFHKPTLRNEHHCPHQCSGHQDNYTKQQPNCYTSPANENYITMRKCTEILNEARESYVNETSAEYNQYERAFINDQRPNCTDRSDISTNENGINLTNEAIESLQRETDFYATENRRLLNVGGNLTDNGVQTDESRTDNIECTHIDKSKIKQYIDHLTGFDAVKSELTNGSNFTTNSCQAPNAQINEMLRSLENHFVEDQQDRNVNHSARSFYEGQNQGITDFPSEAQQRNTNYVQKNTFHNDGTQPIIHSPMDEFDCNNYGRVNQHTNETGNMGYPNDQTVYFAECTRDTSFGENYTGDQFEGTSTNYQSFSNNQDHQSQHYTPCHNKHDQHTADTQTLNDSGHYNNSGNLINEPEGTTKIKRKYCYVPSDENEDGGSIVDQTSYRNYIESIIDNPSQTTEIDSKRQLGSSINLKNESGFPNQNDVVELETDKAIDLVLNESSRQMDSKLCMEITQRLTDSLVQSQKDIPSPCLVALDEPVYLQQLKKLRWDHLRHIEREVKRLESLERFLDSCGCGHMMYSKNTS